MKIFDKIRLWFLEKMFTKTFASKHMPFCIHPVFRKGKAGYDSWKIKGYTYVWLTPWEGTEDIVHITGCDFGIWEDVYIDEQEGEFHIEDTEHPFFKTWHEAFLDAKKKKK